MCGIVAFSGVKKPNPDWLKLCALFNDNRGGDSVGWIDAKNKINKSIFPSTFNKVFVNEPIDLDGNKSLIFHARKSSVGVINFKNTHPFVINDDLVGVHNGTLKFLYQLVEKYHKKHPHLNKQQLNCLGTDSETFFNILDETKDIDLFKDYEGAGVFIWKFLKDKNDALYIFKGKSEKLESERPLFSMKDGDNMYFSSMREPFDIISQNYKNVIIKEVDSNKIIKVKKGKIESSTIINREIKEEFYNTYDMRNYSEYSEYSGKPVIVNDHVHYSKNNMKNNKMHISTKNPFDNIKEVDVIKNFNKLNSSTSEHFNTYDELPSVELLSEDVIYSSHLKYKIKKVMMHGIYTIWFDVTTNNWKAIKNSPSLISYFNNINNEEKNKFGVTNFAFYKGELLSVDFKTSFEFIKLLEFSGITDVNCIIKDITISFSLNHLKKFFEEIKLDTHAIQTTTGLKKLNRNTVVFINPSKPNVNSTMGLLKFRFCSLNTNIFIKDDVIIKYKNNILGTISNNDSDITLNDHYIEFLKIFEDKLQYFVCDETDNGVKEIMTILKDFEFDIKGKKGLLEYIFEFLINYSKAEYYYLEHYDSTHDLIKELNVEMTDCIEVLECILKDKTLPSNFVESDFKQHHMNASYCVQCITCEKKEYNNHGCKTCGDHCYMVLSEFEIEPDDDDNEEEIISKEELNNNLVNHARNVLKTFEDDEEIKRLTTMEFLEKVNNHIKQLQEDIDYYEKNDLNDEGKELHELLEKQLNEIKQKMVY